MNEAAITRFITDTFAGVDIVDASGNTFFFHDPDHQFPFATLVISDEYDQASDLNRPAVFRLNIGVGKATYQSLFGSPSSQPDAEHDFTALDQILPHPVYGKMYWACVLNPSEATFEQAVRPLLAEAYEMAVARIAKRG